MRFASELFFVYQICIRAFFVYQICIRVFFVYLVSENLMLKPKSCVVVG